MVERYKRKPNTKCSVCDKPIYRRPYDLDMRGGRAYCSSSCYGLTCRKEISCIACGKTILSQFRKKTCNRACANKYRTGVRYKQGGVGKDKAKIQKALKVKLLKERGHVCERCSYDKSEILQVHHKNGNHNDNRMVNLELICPNCHCEEHYLK